MKDEPVQVTEDQRGWFQKFVRRLLGVDEVLKELRSIDKRLQTIESCVKSNGRTHGAYKYLVTGHWND